MILQSQIRTIKLSLMWSKRWWKLARYWTWKITSADLRIRTTTKVSLFLSVYRCIWLRINKERMTSIILSWRNQSIRTILKSFHILMRSTTFSKQMRFCLMISISTFLDLQLWVDTLDLNWSSYVKTLCNLTLKRSLLSILSM